MKTFILTASLVFAAFAVNAQKFKVSLTDKLKYISSPNVVRVEDGYLQWQTIDTRRQLAYTFKLNRLKFGIRLMKYNNQMQLVNSAELSNGDRLYGPLQPFTRELNKKLYLFYYEFTDLAADNNMKLMATEIDPATLTTGTPFEVLAVDQKNFGLFKTERLFDNAAVIIKQSPDNTKTLVAWTSGLNEEVIINILGPDFKSLRQKTERFPGAERLELNAVAVDNAGTAYIAYKRTGAEYFEARLLINTAQAKKSVDKLIKLTKGHPYQAQLTLSERQHKLFISGLYVGEKSSLTGAYCATVALGSTEIDELAEIDFPVELVAQYDEDGWASTKKKKYGIDGMWMQAAELEDGSIAMAGEFRRTDWGQKATFYISGSMLVVNMKNGKAVFTRIPKYRVSAGSTIGDSYYFMPYKDQALLFYADHTSNLKQDITKAPSNSNNYRNSVLVAALVNSKGELRRDVILDLSDDNFFAIADRIRVLSPDKLLVPVQKIKGFGGLDDDFKWGTIELIP